MRSSRRRATVTHSVDMLRAKVKGLLEGLEAEVSVAVDVMLPTSRLVDALQAFQATFPTVPLRLHVETLGAVTQLVSRAARPLSASAVRSMSIRDRPRTHRHRRRGARPRRGSVPSTGALRCTRHPARRANYIQLVLTDRSKLTEGQDFGVISMKSWRPRRSRRQARLAASRRRLGQHAGGDGARATSTPAGWSNSICPEWSEGIYPLKVLHRTDTPPGPAAQWLIERFKGGRNSRVLSGLQRTQSKDLIRRTVLRNGPSLRALARTTG